jgi:hypothetical protein
VGNLLQWKYLDPIGGMILSTYIIWQWCRTLHENFTNCKQDLDGRFTLESSHSLACDPIVSGKAADGEEVTRILYLVSRFKPVLQISYCEIYHIGDELIAEIDVILPQASTLHYAHDATETLQ